MIILLLFVYMNVSFYTTTLNKLQKVSIHNVHSLLRCGYQFNIFLFYFALNFMNISASTQLIC